MQREYVINCKVFDVVFAEIPNLGIYGKIFLFKMKICARSSGEKKN